MKISIVIPAHNAAETISETLESVCAQTFLEWEAFVVDDGSTDETAAIVAVFVERDPRIHLIRQSNLGACAARNKGMGLAQFKWLLFLDADDLLLPHHLERMTETLRTNPNWDAVYCKWDRITVNGEIVKGDTDYPSDNLFEVLAERPLFPPLACVLRRSLVEEVGGWDTSFRCCQDWDLWQRCTRTHARFGALDEVLGYYRMRPGSVSTRAPVQLLTHGWRVINQGYACDPRVSNPDPRYATGLSTADQSNAQLIWLSWCAGLALGLGLDASILLELANDVRRSELDPFYVADCIFRAVPHSVGRLPNVWIELWPSLEEGLDKLLMAMEAQLVVPDLARHARTMLERLILENVERKRPAVIGAAYATVIDVTQPVTDLIFEDSIKWLHCEVTYAQQALGVVEIPIVDGFLSQKSLKDVIATAFAWPLLGLYFKQTIYPHLQIKQGTNGLALWRGNLCLVDGLSDGKDLSWDKVHDEVGWVVFLQEVWDRPEWPGEVFYEPQHPEAPSPCACFVHTHVNIEVSEAFTDIVTRHQEVAVTLSVGGARLGCVTVPVNENLIRAQEIRAALTTMGGFDLCRLAVREGIIGKSLTEPVSLRERLSTAARYRSNELRANPFTRIMGFLRKSRLTEWLHK